MNTVNGKTTTMSEHRYILQPYKGMNSRYRCPGCQNRDKTFSLYIDTETGSPIADHVGRCNRESNCGYHYTPKQFFQDNHISFDRPAKTVSVSTNLKSREQETQQKPVEVIPVDTFKQSLQVDKNTTAVAEGNHFVKFLIEIFGVDVADHVRKRYFIGTSKHWPGATVFWQIDLQGEVRTGKIMLYNPVTGKRVKEPYNHISWVHKAIHKPEFELQQCLFACHLLRESAKPIALFESEKSAIIASMYLPGFICLAVGSLSNLTATKCEVLRGRSVTLFPDLNGFEKWSAKAHELSHIATFTVSDLLERKATSDERQQGLDLADYLVRFDYREFALREPQPAKPEPPATVQPVIERKPFVPANYFTKLEQPKPESWEPEIAELESYFKGLANGSIWEEMGGNETFCDYLRLSIKLNSFTTITNVSLFLESHFATVKANNGKRTFLPFLNRLQELKQYFTQTLN